jgi:hypothetical protein
VKEGKTRALPSEMKYNFCYISTLGLTDLLFSSVSWYYIKTAVRVFSKTLGASAKFWAPER